MPPTPGNELGNIIVGYLHQKLVRTEVTDKALDRASGSRTVRMMSSDLIPIATGSHVERQRFRAAR